MRKIKIITILVTVTLFCILLTAGCEEEQTPGMKQSKLIAEQNMQLKKQLEQKDIEITKLKQQLNQCEIDKVKMQRQQREEINSVGEGVIEIFEENVKLKEEVEQLKNQLEEAQNN